MSSERFHKAARDCSLAVLKEATKRDCNSKDEDGMTPTMWAAFEGHLDALRLIVARGGDPDKADNFGNTALHHAAERGHSPCVKFLVNFGANAWSLNYDSHTPKELAAINNKDDILQFLDEACAKEEATDRKGTKAKKEKAQKEFEKKTKEYEKIKKKAEKGAVLEQERLKKLRQKMGSDFADHPGGLPHRPSTMFSTLRSRALGQGTVRSTISASPRFSEIVGTVSAASGKKLGITSAVARKAQHRKFGTQRGGDPVIDELTTIEVEDGRKSILRRDSEVLYVGKYDGEGRRGKLEGVFDQDDLIEGKDEEDYNNENEDVLLQEPASIFDRPGFGSFAFRKSITSTLSALPIAKDDDFDEVLEGQVDGESIGSAGSLVKRHGGGRWHGDDDLSDDDSLGDGSPLALFLVASGLGEYISRFEAEKVDLEALLLLTDEDLNTLGLPLGPKRKLIQAIANRKQILSAPGHVHDSQL